MLGYYSLELLRSGLDGNVGQLDLERGVTRLLVGELVLLLLGSGLGEDVGRHQHSRSSGCEGDDVLLLPEVLLRGHGDGLNHLGVDDDGGGGLFLHFRFLS